MAGAHDTILQRQVPDPEGLKQRILVDFVGVGVGHWVNSSGSR
jgi:hypothetical protein